MVIILKLRGRFFILMYYLRRVKLAATYLAVLYTLLVVLIALSGKIPTLSIIVSYLTFSIQPQNEVEALAALVSMLINMTPVLGVFEIKAISPEEKALLKAEHMSDHVVIVGYGHLGSRVCKAMERAGIPFVLIVRPEDATRKEEVREMIRRGLPVVLGDATQESTLRKASIERAVALVITVNNDTVNLIASEKAKKINPNLRVITRIYNEDLAEIALRSGFADEAFSTTKLVYALFAAACLFDVVPLPGLVSMKVHKGAPIIGNRVIDIEKKTGIAILAVMKPDGHLERGGEVVIEEEDTIISVVEPEKLKALSGLL